MRENKDPQTISVLLKLVGLAIFALIPKLSVLGAQLSNQD
tara:strand:+ start:464 stop:583 length:120 start_codon:yes stop_codon:yes gene_type:complete